MTGRIITRLQHTLVGVQVLRKRDTGRFAETIGDAGLSPFDVPFQLGRHLPGELLIDSQGGIAPLAVFARVAPVPFVRCLPLAARL
jgi:hypothetical protein